MLIPRRLWRRVNSYGRDLPHGAEREPADILVHPADAADRGRRRRRARVRRERVRPPERASRQVDESIRRGAVAIPHGWADPNVSTLLSASEGVDPLTGMPTYSGVPITLSAV